jgi:hypothetical protein
MNIHLTGPQMQHLIDRYNLDLNLEDGTAVARRKDGRDLKASTVAKMVGLKETPENWWEKDGAVRNL